MVWVVTALYKYGIYEGIKSIVAFPFAYPAFLAPMLPGVSVLFVGMCMHLVFYSKGSADFPLRISAIAVLVIIFGIGVVKTWGGMRYLIESYPFIIFVASAGLLGFSGYLCQVFNNSSYRYAMTSAILIVLSGVMGGHGLPQAIGAATLNYGDNLSSFKFKYYPDHKGAGEFVRDRRAPGDIVIAEDPLQQYWYAGPVDYWLRDVEDASSFLYQTSDGLFRDIYVNSVQATVDTLTTIAQSNKRIWIITSAETYQNRKNYLNDQQRIWLDDIETRYTPHFVGRDDITKVYCLNCNSSNSQ
jgi:hypothetical protein